MYNTKELYHKRDIVLREECQLPKVPMWLGGQEL